MARLSASLVRDLGGDQIVFEIPEDMGSFDSQASFSSEDSEDMERGSLESFDYDQ